MERPNETPEAAMPHGAAAAVPSAALTPDEVAGWLARMATGGDLSPLADATPAHLCDILTNLELLKNAAAAAQSRATVLGATKLREEALERGVRPSKADKGVASALALARRESPHAGSRHVGFAKALVLEMPHLHAAMTAGLVTEWTATQIVRETACLSKEHRAAVDAALAGRLGSESHKRLVAAAKAKAYELDPTSVVRRGRKAVSDRRVSVRPAPDVMAIVSGYVPVAQGVACYKALNEAALALKAKGDERSLDQIRADLFTQRLTGQAVAEDVGVEVQLVMTDRALFGDSEEAAHLEGYGPIPAGLARDMVRGDEDTVPQDAATTATPDGNDLTATEGNDAGPPPAPTESTTRREAMVWLRRLFADPRTGTLTGVDPRRRRFDGALRRFLVARDQVCRTPYCQAPVRHLDHILPWRLGGPTVEANGQGLCEACNYEKEASGWSHEVVTLPGGTHTVKITTPTGHTYYSQPDSVLPVLAPDGNSGTSHADAPPGEPSVVAPGEDSARPDPAPTRSGESSARPDPAPTRSGEISAPQELSPLERQVLALLRAA